jgi:hypothetical protein
LSVAQRAVSGYQSLLCRKLSGIVPEDIELLTCALVGLLVLGQLGLSAELGAPLRASVGRLVGPTEAAGPGLLQSEATMP